MSHPPTPTVVLRRGLTAPGPPTRLATLDAAPLSLRARNLSRLLLLLTVLAAGCGYDKATRWDVPQALVVPPLCSVGDVRCGVQQLQRCEKTDKGLAWVALDDCASHDQVCVPSLLECKACQPNTVSCDGQDVIRCDATGNKKTREKTCSGEGIACREGACVDLCGQAKVQRSNVGCEYWAVDLDNADINDSLNAAAQQFAVVVSNPQPDVSANVDIDQDDTDPGQPGAPISIANTAIPPLGLRVFKLGPREVDGSPPGEFNTGTNTALTRHAYRISSDVPVVAYQFNPLENVNVFSNDASLLKPVEALSDLPGEMTDAYVVLGWPQTIAATQNPDTNFNPSDPINLRVFLTIVGTRPDTHVLVDPRAEIVAGGPVADTKAGGQVEMTLNPFNVLNLETGDFNADFTGSLIQSDQPVVVFSGSEASDAPFFSKLAFRQCCADHLEEQLDPVRTSGRKFVASLSSNRTQAVAQAGATLGVVAQPEYFRIIATTDAGATVKTTLTGGLSNIKLAKKGSFVDIATQRNFMFESDQPVQLGDVMPSQDAAGVPRGLPGGIRASSWCRPSSSTAATTCSSRRTSTASTSSASSRRRTRTSCSTDNNSPMCPAAPARQPMGSTRRRAAAKRRRTRCTPAN